MAAENGMNKRGWDQGTDPSSNGIDENLKRLYDDLFEDEIPDRFKDLLQRLREQDENGGGQGDPK